MHGLHICYVSWELPPQFGGGIGTYVAAITTALARRGHDVTVVTIGDTAYPRREIRDGVTIVRLPVGGGGGHGVTGTLRAWQARADAVADVLRKLARAGLDLIEFADYRGEGTTFLTGTPKSERPCCVVRLHTPLSVLNRFNPSGTRQPVLEEYEHQAICAADRIVSPSDALVRQVRGRVDLPEVDISPHPVDGRFLQADGAPADDSGEVLYVGRFEERKGVETLARAAPAFLEDCPAARLVMIGGDTQKGPGAPSMKRVVRDLIPARYAERVSFVDPMPRTELLERYRAARCCVFPSHFENFPNTCLEAMALGKVVVGTRETGMAEMIDDGTHGVLVAPQDAAALAHGLRRAFTLASDQRRAIGAAARQRVLERYAPDVIAERTAALYAGYVAAHAGRGATRGPAKEVRDTEAPGRSAASQPVAVGSRAGTAPTEAPPKAAAAPDRPRVAVVIPCYNHGRYVREALRSVAKQTYPEIEVVVVDDGSTDVQTCRVLDELVREGVRVVRQENQGLSAARNTGVSAVNAPFYVPLDADDRIEPTFIERLIEPLLAEPALGYVYSHVAFFGDAGGTWECPDYDPRRLLVENLGVATAVVRRRAFDEAGGYSREMVHGFEDWDFWIALLSLGYHGHCVPEPLFGYRKHAGGSMLSETQRRRREMVHRMIEHHRTLFASTLEVSFAQKDQMFFQAHMDAWRLRESIVQSGGSVERALSTVDDELYQALLARAELDYIENSRFWRTFQSLKRNPLFRAFTWLRYGSRWQERAAGEDPRARLARVKSSRTYRLIQAVKATAPYRWYARRKYGPDFDKPPDALSQVPR